MHLNLHYQYIHLHYQLHHLSFHLNLEYSIFNFILIISNCFMWSHLNLINHHYYLHHLHHHCNRLLKLKILLIAPVTNNSFYYLVKLVRYFVFLLKKIKWLTNLLTLFKKLLIWTLIVCITTSISVILLCY